MWRRRWRALAIQTATDPAKTLDLEAAEWRAALAHAREEDRERFEAWRDRDPANARAYDRLAAAEATAISVRDTSEMLAIRHETLTRLSLGRRRHRQDRRRLFGAMAAAAAVALIVGPLATWIIQTDGSRRAAPAEIPTYSTAIGQRMALTLQDGSHVTLNTASRIRIDYSGTERRLYLDAGQAWFEVAHDAARPFNVVAGDTMVTAHGTRFDVRLKPGSIQVLLSEGKISVAAHGAGPATVAAMLSPNDLLTADAAGMRVRRVADTGVLESWRDGVVVFDDQPLAEVAAEINRYTTRPLVLRGGRIAGIRVSGVYRIGEEAVFVEALEKGFDLAADRSRADRISLVARR